MRFKITGCCIALLLLLTATAFAQGWTFQYKQDLSYSFNAVHFATSSVGWIVGDAGVIMKSTDGGFTWVQQTSPTGQTLNDVWAVDATHAWAVGGAGTIIYTTDGTNWLVHPQSGVVMTSSITAVQFIGLNGWIGGGVDQTQAKLFYTTDGGTTWTAPLTNPSTDYCTDLSFFDALHGYAACDNKAPLMMYTTDGGVNWSASTVNLGPYPYTRTDVECVKAGADNVTAFAAGWGSLVGAQPTIVLMTTDGGAHFNSPNTSYPWQTFGYGYGVTVFPDDWKTLIVGGGSTITAFQISAVSPYTSWVRDPGFYGYQLNDVSAIPGTTHCVAVGNAGCIALSLDKGHSWTYDFRAGTRFQGIMCFTDWGKDKVMAIGSASEELIFDLASGTYTHTVASPEGWGPVSMWDVDYVQNKRMGSGGGGRDSTYNDVIYACGENEYLVKTWNFGKTWKQLQHTVSNYDALGGMYWFNVDTGFVVGNVQKATSRRAEVIWRTRNGGVTLDTVLVRTLKSGAATFSYQWNDIDFAPGNRIGAVVGTANKIRHTTDGGVTWPLATENIVDSTIALTKVHMTNSQVGYACGDKGTVIKTVDGGATWTVITPVPWAATVNLLDCCFRTPTWGYVVGDLGNCYYTSNGGATWTNISPTTEIGTTRLKSVYYQGPAGIIWIGSEYANILTRSDGPAATTPKNLPFVLNQNYPNPFNPSTTIAFTLAADDHVTLKVYDVAGRLVANVMNKDLKAGKYSIGFKAEGLASGMYFYTLKTSASEETRKMVLLR